ncbi:MAG: hypothetical protein KMY55_07480 [Dethiosulfatibacter sp.]|nr:hypothetical protein [Dethiosulfatibacter sp.]
MFRFLKRKITVLLSVVLLFSSVFGSFATAAPVVSGGIDYEIINPYETVDWENFGQYKANFHNHTFESDGSASPAAMIEEHYLQGFDVIALTDHNFTNTTMDRTDRPIVNSSGNPLTYLTPERLADINAGVGRDGRVMINVPYSNEQSRSDHLLTFWADFNNASGATLESNIAAAHDLAGLSQLAHPGRYTGGRTTSNDGEDGAILSSNPFTVKKYVDLLQAYSSVVGMEIINKKDGDSFSDRILWDNILKQTMPERPVWAFSNDDAHSVGAIGFSYNIMLMPENTLENVRSSMQNGTFYAVALVAKRELGFDFIAEGPAPAITNIAVDQEENSITLEGEYFDRIEWIAHGKIIATGTTIDLNDYEEEVRNYIRAQLIGDGGISFTQPFGIMGGEEREPELEVAVLAADGNNINSDAKKGIQLTLEGILDTAEYVNIESAEVEYRMDPTDILAISADGIVTVQHDPIENQNVAIWAEVTLEEKTVRSNTISILVTPAGQIVVPVINGMDDVEERISDGYMYMNSSDLEITHDGSRNQIIGTRFQALMIPEGAKIVEAYIQFTVDENKDSKNIDPFNVDIHAEKISDSPMFTTDPYNLSTRSFTENIVNWKDIPKWTIVHEAGPDQRTPNLSVLVQEVVDMNGWNEGNAITFSLRGVGVRCAEAFEGGGTTQSPRLYIKYITLENQIKNLKSEVEELDVNLGIKNSLSAKLDNAMQMLEKNKNASVNMLGAFINQINALERSGRISTEDTVDFIDTAKEIIDRI